MFASDAPVTLVGHLSSLVAPYGVTGCHEPCNSNSYATATYL